MKKKNKLPKERIKLFEQITWWIWAGRAK